MGTGSVAQTSTISGETSSPRCLSPFFAAHRWSVAKGDRHRRRRPYWQEYIQIGDGASPHLRLPAILCEIDYLKTNKSSNYGLGDFPVKKSPSVGVSVLCIMWAVCWANCAGADDWPAWRGPNRDGICREKGLLKEWPKDGPEAALEGHRTGHRLQRTGHRRQRPLHMGDKDDKEWVLALDVSQAGQADLGLADRSRSATTAAAIPARDPRPPSTATGSTPWASPAIWCAWTSRTAGIIWRQRPGQGFRRRHSAMGIRRVGADRRAVGGLHARRARRTPSSPSTRPTASWSGARPSAIRPTTPRSSRSTIGNVEAVRQPDEEGRDRRGGQGRQVPLALRRPGQQSRQLLDLRVAGRHGLRRQRLRHRRRAGPDRADPATASRPRRSTSPRRCRTTTAA